MIRLALLIAIAASAPQPKASPLDEASVRAHLADRTTLAGDGAIGWQVEYTAPDGVAWIWQPGAKPLAGRWTVRTHRGETQVCFTYPVNASTPGEEKCGDAAYPLGLAGKVSVESRQGDVFGLADGEAPRETHGKPAWPSPPVR